MTAFIFKLDPVIRRGDRKMDCRVASLLAMTGFFFVSVLFSNPAHAGAWLQEKGHGLWMAQATYFTSEEFFDAEGALVPQPRFSKLEFQPYGEYGLTDKITIGGTAYLHQVSQSGDHNPGLADPEVFARMRLWHNARHVLSIQPLVKLPGLYRDGGVPRGGSRSLDAELALLYGRNLSVLSDHDYTDTRIGYRWRSRGLAPQWRADFAAGFYLGEHWLIVPGLHAVLTPDADENRAFSENGEQDYNLYKAELTGAYLIDDRRWIQLSLFDHIGGINAGAGRGLSLAYAERF